MTEELLVAPCSRKAAEFAVKNWHYSRQLPAGKLATYGVWENGDFIGAVLFGQGATPNLGAPYDLTVFETSELARVALTDHEAPVSQIVPQAIRQLKETMPGLRLLISFADSYRGHTGFIYQAMNWIYLGETARKKIFMDKEGRQYHDRYVGTAGERNIFGKMVKTPKITDMAKTIVVPQKYRYGWPLDKSTRRKLAKMAQPYPTEKH